MRYKCDCGASYSNLDALYACQSSNHGQPSEAYIRDVLQAEIARLRESGATLTNGMERLAGEIVSKNAEIARLLAALRVARMWMPSDPATVEEAEHVALVDAALQPREGE